MNRKIFDNVLYSYVNSINQIKDPTNVKYSNNRNRLDCCLGVFCSGHRLHTYTIIVTVKKRPKQYFNPPRRGRKKRFYKFCEANVLEARNIQIKNWRLL